MSNLLKKIAGDLLFAALIRALGNRVFMNFIELIKHENQRVSRLRLAKVGQLLLGLATRDLLPNRFAGVTDITRPKATKRAARKSLSNDLYDTPQLGR